MKKSCAAALALFLGFAISGEARAVIGATDVAPAATLLYPHFEVDLANSSGVTTLIGIHNSSATAVLVHVTLWTDLGVPTERFNVYLTGYDTQTWNLRDVFQSGTIPRTASAGQDPADTISNHGTYSQDINFASCAMTDPDVLDPFGDDGPASSYGLPPPSPFVTSVYRVDLQRVHQGLSSTGLYGNAGRCLGTARGDGVVRGYLTADATNSCSVEKPTSAGYLAAVVTFQNVLFGDFLIVNPSQNFAEGDLAVHIEAHPSDPATNTDGRYTFYGAFDGGLARNHREALPTKFIAHWLTDSDLISWRDAAQPPPTGGFVCGSFGPFPMNAAQVQPFDTEENPLAYAAGRAFTFAEQRDRVDDTPFPGISATKQGWIYVDLNETGVKGSVYGSEIRQGWLFHHRRPEPPSGQGRFSSMSPAIHLDNAGDYAPPGPARAGGAR